MLVVNQQIQIPLEEFRFTFSRSPGPGGQNVNKVNSKATLHWNVTTTTNLPEPVRQRLLKKFHRRINQEGEFFISSSRYRDAPRNEADCLDKLRAMIEEAAVAQKPRRATRPTAASKRRRRDNKRRQSEKKQQRRPPRFE